MFLCCGTGRFVRDPELREITKQDGTTTNVLEFSLATQERRGDKKFTHFLDMVAWDKGAELLAKFCKKGDQIFVQATPRQDKWKTDDGQNRSRIIFRVDQFEFLGKARANRENEEETETDNF